MRGENQKGRACGRGACGVRRRATHSAGAGAGSAAGAGASFFADFFLPPYFLAADFFLPPFYLAADFLPPFFAAFFVFDAFLALLFFAGAFFPEGFFPDSFFSANAAARGSNHSPIALGRWWGRAELMRRGSGVQKL